MKKMKKITMLLAALTLLLALTACSSAPSVVDGSSGNTKAPTCKLNMADIVWEVSSGIIEGERYAVFSYTNNTRYPILSMEMEFTQKDEVTAEEKTAFCDRLSKDWGLDEEWDAEIRDMPIGMSAETERLVAPGESLDGVCCHYYHGYRYVRNFEHTQLVRPDIATIRYVDGGQILIAYYDFISEKFTLDSETQSADFWPNNALTGLVSKPDASVICDEYYSNDDDDLYCKAYGISREAFDAYVSECKSRGFTVDDRDSDDYYRADNEQGYYLSLEYDAESCTMQLHIAAPDPAENQTD